MNSRELGQFQKGFSKWYPFNDESIKDAPKQPGVYVLRKAGGQSFGRLRGKSDILGIGKTDAKRGLRQRLGQHLHPGRTIGTSRRISEFAKKYRMEVAWCPYHEPRNLEHELLSKYVSEHDELPPLNHARPRQKKISYTLDAILVKSMS